ncbi:4a-hydroxytetrahydrobiopterin dehydratase [Planctomycetales bacterium 10988]|nr:4a-hydroxytetrahydrobiopterin dehydratase [Planctomycetales bacterium 10988]
MASTSTELQQKKCLPCEGGVDAMTPLEASDQLAQLEGWELIDEGKKIKKKWQVKNFMAGMEFFQKVAELAEQEQHHPDLHLVGYRNAKIELTTHAVGGLSENDFILAAKIDALPVKTG